MFRQLSKHFPDSSSGDSSSTGQQARRKLNRALLFGALLLVVSIASPFLLSNPKLPPDTNESAPAESSPAAATPERTPAPTDPSPVDFSSPGVIIAILLLSGGIGLALYLRNGTDTKSAQNGIIVPIAEYKISADQRLQLVHCTDELLLLAISPEHIELLKTYPADKLPVDTGSPADLDDAQLPPTAGFNGSPFAKVLQHYAAPYTNGNRT